jgi:sulfoxide reductase heme-binding subunit YedZ
MARRSWAFWLKLLASTGAFIPLTLLTWDYVQGHLSANPIEDITLRTGKAALLLLILSLSVTPVSKASGVRALIPLRRILGLYAFFYASLHLLTFVGLDYRFDLALIREDVLEKRFALVGLAAFLSLLPLAMTSTKGWRKRLGCNWERLHWLVYLSGLLAATHFILQAKIDLRQPLLYTVIVVLLLATRIPAVMRVIG